MCCEECQDICNVVDVRTPYNKLNTFLNIKGKELIEAMYYGYHCKECIEKDLLKGRLFKNALGHIQKSKILGQGVSCMCDEHIQKLIEKVNKLTEFCYFKEEVEVDTSGREEFLFNNPACVNFESWERFSEKACKTIGFDLEVKKDKCDVMFQLSRDIISTDLLFAIKVYKEVCDLGYKISRTEEECKIDFELLKEKHDCNLTFKTYLKLIKCNVSYTLINEALKCNLDIVVRNKEPYLKTVMGDYPIKSLHTSNIEYLRELGKEITIDKKDITVDYE